MIKWRMGRIYYDGRMYKANHTFEFGNKKICFDRFQEDRYPSLENFVLTMEDAEKLKDWLDEIITEKREKNKENKR